MLHSKKIMTRIQLYLKVVTVCLAFESAAHAADYLRLYAESAEINGRPVKLAIDTGSGGSFLLPSTAERLGLRLEVSSPKPSDDAADTPCTGTVTCKLACAGSSARERFYILDLPKSIPALNEEGFLGWPFLQKKIFSIDVAAQRVVFLKTKPSMTGKWVKLRLHPRADDGLIAELPATGDLVLFDTGAPQGIYLRSNEWTRWRKANLRAPLTILDPGYRLGIGTQLLIESWAHHLTIGPISLFETPVTTWDAILNDSSTRHGFVASVGLAAMGRLEMIVDGPGGMLYLRPRQGDVLRYAHNRAGVGFEAAKDDGNRLHAVVLPGTPAYEAGIRNGDVLLGVDGFGLDDPSRQNRELSFLDRSESPKNQMRLARDGIEYETSFVVRDLLGPDVPDLPKSIFNVYKEDFGGLMP